MTARASRQTGLVHGRLTAALGVIAWIAMIAVFGVLWWRNAFVEVQRYEVLSAQGTTSVGGVPVGPGAAGTLVEGTRLATGPASVISVRLAEGSVLQLAPDTVVEVLEARTSGAGDTHRTVLKLDAGEIIRRLPPAGSDDVERRSELVTPSVTIGVRGTEFAASVEGDVARAVVHRGQVALATAAARPKDLTENYGTRVARGQAPEEPSVLLPPPQPVAPEPSARLEATAATLAWAEVPGAAAYVAELALDAGFDAALGRAGTSATVAAVPALPFDTPVHWRVASVDKRGLRGRGSEPRLAHYKVHHARLRARLDAGDGAGALALAPAALKGYPEDPDLLADLGWAHYLAGDFATARGLYDRALSRDPRNFRALLRRGRAEFWLKDYAAAEADYRRALELSQPPDDADALWGLGDTLRVMGRVPEAVEKLEEALARAPDHPYAGLSLAQAIAPQQPARARQLVEKHLLKHPQDPAALQLQAELN